MRPIRKIFDALENHADGKTSHFCGSHFSFFCLVTSSISQSVVVFGTELYGTSFLQCFDIVGWVI